MEKETFMYISSIGWSWISAISTFLAVIIALAMPFILEYRKNKNILKIIEKEYESNYNLIKNANNTSNKQFSNVQNDFPEINIDGLTIEYKINTLFNINLINWDLYKNILASSNSDKYLYYQEKNKVIQELKEYAKKIKNNSTNNISEKEMYIINERIFIDQLNNFENN